MPLRPAKRRRRRKGPKGTSSKAPGDWGRWMTGKIGASNGAPSSKESSLKGGEVVPERLAKTASSPTQRAEKTRREVGERLPRRGMQGAETEGDGIARLHVPD